MGQQGNTIAVQIELLDIGKEVEHVYLSRKLVHDTDGRHGGVDDLICTK